MNKSILFIKMLDHASWFEHCQMPWFGLGKKVLELGETACLLRHKLSRCPQLRCKYMPALGTWGERSLVWVLEVGEFAKISRWLQDGNSRTSFSGLAHL